MERIPEISSGLGISILTWEIPGDLWVVPGEGEFGKGRDPSRDVVPYSPPSKVAIFSRELISVIVIPGQLQAPL